MMLSFEEKNDFEELYHHVERSIILILTILIKIIIVHSFKISWT